ncbi:unnamed protein product [Calicophoron daubneyi]
MNVAADIAWNCLLKTMKKQKCDTSTVSGMFSGVSSLIGKRSILGGLSGISSKSQLSKVINSDHVNALTGMCNACTGCKMSAKQCVLTKAVAVKEGQCNLVDKLKGFVL